MYLKIYIHLSYICLTVVYCFRSQIKRSQHYNHCNWNIVNSIKYLRYAESSCQCDISQLNCLYVNHWRMQKFGVNVVYQKYKCMLSVRCTEPTLAFLIGQIVADLTVTARQPERLYCLQSCFGVPNGDYQACHSCGDYVTCHEG